MRVYFPRDRRISMAMERIRQAFIKYAPEGTTFQRSLEGDPVHCINWIGQNPKEHTERCEVVQAVPTLPLTEKYIVFAHLGNPHYRELDAHYQNLLGEALLVITYDKRILGYEGPNIYETPWGYEPSTFYHHSSRKRFKILCTGYMADAEAIDAAWDACGKLAVKLCHVGGRLRGIPGGRWYERYEGIKDHEMRVLYNQSEYVSGMRREGGFELPVIEGYACGCQPVVFDHPTMKKYYSDFAIYVPRVPRYELARRLQKVLLHSRNITPNQEILERFHWSTVMASMWSRILEAS